MTYTEIDLKIKEFQEKLKNKLNVKVGRKKKKTKKQPHHLIKFYTEEIDKLERLKSILENQKTESLNFSWDNVIFEDYKIRLTDSKIIYGPIQLPDSRKSFEYLKPYFNKLNLKPLICTIKGNEIIEILNLDEIHEIIQVFSFKTLILNFSAYQVSDFQKNIEKLKNKTTISISNLHNKSDYFKHLINLNDIDSKIIPLLENGNLREDSFIFTIKNNNMMYLVWESCLEKKATYIFSSMAVEYIQIAIKIVKFILSEQTTRMDLRQNFIRENLNEINCSLIYHNDFQDWKNKLAKKLES